MSIGADVIVPALLVIVVGILQEIKAELRRTYRLQEKLEEAQRISKRMQSTEKQPS